MVLLIAIFALKVPTVRKMKIIHARYVILSFYYLGGSTRFFVRLVFAIAVAYSKLGLVTEILRGRGTKTTAHGAATPIFGPFYAQLC